MADTICVQERLPPGAAAVLINRTHTYTDLYLPIDATEKRLFDAIDGDPQRRRHRGENVAVFSRTDLWLDLARTFFERLWWYDQVVFDMSRSPSGRTPHLETPAREALTHDRHRVL